MADYMDPMTGRDRRNRFSGLLDDVPAAFVEAPTVETLRVEGAPVKVGGANGWYDGDAVHTTPAEGLTSSTQALERFGGGFSSTYSALPWRHPVTGEPSDQFRAVVRGSDQKVIGQVTKAFEVIQPEEFFGLLDAVGDGSLEIDRGGEFYHGRELWMQTRTATFELPNGPAESRMLMGLPLTGNGAAWANLFNEAVFCRNVYRSGKGKSTTYGKARSCWKVRHTRNAHERLVLLRAAFEGSVAHMEDVRNWLWGLHGKSINTATLNGLLEDVFAARRDENGKLSAQAQHDLARWRRIYEEAPGAAPGTLYGVAQASSFYASHIAKVRKGESLEACASGEYNHGGFRSAMTGPGGQHTDLVHVHLQRLAA